MAWIFDFSKENDDYRQRIAVVFCALFERDFLEDFYTVLEELFNGNYSILGLKKAVYKNRIYLMREQNDIKPIIEKDNKKSETFANSVLKTMALLFLLGEVYFEMQRSMENNEYNTKLEEELTILSDTIITIESQRSIYLSIVREGKLPRKDLAKITSKLEELDDIFINACRSIKKFVQEITITKENQNDDITKLCNDVIDTVSSILNARQLERKFFGRTNINMNRFQ